jgi:nucleoside-diphosphate-sugar epimerase
MSDAAFPAVVTGATGFVGRSLVAQLGALPTMLHLGEDDWRAQVDLAPFGDARVFHLAARVHDPDPGDDRAWSLDNVEKTRVLAEAARARGARRFVFLSSVKVLGEESPGRGLRSDDPARPADAYARSKLAAETLLRGLANPSFEVVVVRSPLVYGAGVKGNLLALLHLADSGWPLPLGAIRNRRSFVHVDDLARLLVDCAHLPQAPGGTFLAAHPVPVSTSDLVLGLRERLGRPPRLLRVPGSIVELLAGLVGQTERARRLTRSLEIDTTQTEAELGWSAQIGLATALDDMVRAYREAS